jgi:hypothetical protein
MRIGRVESLAPPSFLSFQFLSFPYATPKPHHRQALPLLLLRPCLRIFLVQVLKSLEDQYGHE